MKLHRGQFLKSAGVGLGALSLGGCSRVARFLSQPPLPGQIANFTVGSDDPAIRLLKRCAYGPRPGDVARVQQMGADVWLEEQLNPPAENRYAVNLEQRRLDPAAWRLHSLETLELPPDELFDWEIPFNESPGLSQLVQRELRQATLIRAVYSQWQLREVMVEFWSDHFNISQQKKDTAWLKTVDDRVIRKHALGRFRDLVGASAHSPAMLFYLDNDKNQKGDPATGSGANENYARELMELHTLGVHGGYTQQDVEEVARCFTGWSTHKWGAGTHKWGFNRSVAWWPTNGPRGEFHYDPKKHDDGEKIVLGRRIPAGQGQRDGVIVLDLVSRHPSTAKFLSEKLCRRFVDDDPPAALVERLAEVYLAEDGEIKPWLRALFTSAEFRTGAGRKMKRPHDFTIASLRALNANTDGKQVIGHLRKMGQVPFQWGMPDGYPDRREAWVPSLLARWNFAVALVSNKIGGTTVDIPALVRASGADSPEGRVQALSRLILGAELVPDLASELAGAVGGGAEDAGWQQMTALLLASPANQWR